MADSRPSSLFRDPLTSTELWRIRKNAVSGSSGAQPVSNGMMDFGAFAQWMFLLWGTLCVLTRIKSFFQTVSSSTSEETPTWPGRRHQIYRHAFPSTPRSPIEISVAVILFFFFFFKHQSFSFIQAVFMFSIFSLQSCCHVFVLFYHSASTKANSVKLCCRLQVIASSL